MRNNRERQPYCVSYVISLLIFPTALFFSFPIFQDHCRPLSAHPPNPIIYIYICTCTCICNSNSNSNSLPFCTCTFICRRLLLLLLLIYTLLGLYRGYDSVCTHSISFPAPLPSLYPYPSLYLYSYPCLCL